MEAYWPSLFAKALKGQNIEELLSSISSAPAGGAAAAAPAGAAAADAGAAKEAPKEDSILFDILFAKHLHYREKGGRSCRCRHGRIIRRRRILNSKILLVCLSYRYVVVILEQFVFYFSHKQLIFAIFF